MIIIKVKNCSEDEKDLIKQYCSALDYFIKLREKDYSGTLYIENMKCRYDADLICDFIHTLDQMYCESGIIVEREEI